MQIFKEALHLLPGGVNSPVRAFKSVGGQPIVFDKVKGSKCFDVDGNEYIDYVGSWGPAIVGHGNDEVNAALKAQIDKGVSFGAPCELEVWPHLQIIGSHNCWLNLSLSRTSIQHCCHRTSQPQPCCCMAMSASASCLLC